MQDKRRFFAALPEKSVDLVELPLEEVEARLLRQLEVAGSDPRNALWQLARFYNETDRAAIAAEYVERVLPITTNSNDAAACLLAMGQAMEGVENWPAAVDWYQRARTCGTSVQRDWYFVHNNLGFCANTLENFAEGELWCRKAIEIDPHRSNAHKNLGLALQGLGRLADAARSFVAATHENATDGRSLQHLEALLQCNPELLTEVPGLREEVDACRAAVPNAKALYQEMSPPVQRGWRARWTLLKLDLRRVIDRWLGWRAAR